MIRLSKHLLLIAASFGLLTLSAPSARAERKRAEPEFPAAPPPAVAQTVTVRPGETVAVSLGIHGVRGEQLDFLIRSQPKGGKLSKVQSTGQNTAVVQYTAGNQGGEDRFTYAVRTAEGVSAPAQVSITIVVAPSLPPRLVTDEQLTFAEVVAGQKSSATLTVTNRGGGMAEGDLTVTEPWRVDGGTHYALQGGRSVDFRLVFTPAKAGEFQGSATLGPKPQRVVALQGSAKSPLDVSPSVLEMSAPAGNATRSGKFRVENRTAEPRVIKITASARLLVEASVTLPPSEAKEISILASADNPAAISEKLRLESDSWSVDVPVHGDAFPAKLKFASTTLDFGKVSAGVAAEATAIVENTGGISAMAAVRVDGPFELLAAGLEVPPVGTAKIPVHWRTPMPGTYSATLVVGAGGHEESLPFTVTVAAPAGDNTPRPNPPPAEAATTTAVAPAIPSESPALKPHRVDLSTPIPVAEAPLRKYARAITAHGVVLEWPVATKPGPPFSLMAREFGTKPDGTPNITWTPVSTVHFSEAAGSHTAEVKGLEPERMYTLRVVGNGGPVFTEQFFTPPSESIVSTQTVLISGLLLIFAGMIWWKIRTRVRTGW